MDQPRSVAAIGTTGHDDLVAALRPLPGGEAAFRALPKNEQIALIDWLNRASDHQHRRRRVRLLVAIVTRVALDEPLERSG